MSDLEFIQEQLDVERETSRRLTTLLGEHRQALNEAEVELQLLRRLGAKYTVAGKTFNTFAEAEVEQRKYADAAIPIKAVVNRD